MLEQLKELLEMQKAYDNAVMAEHGLVYNYEIAEKVKIACLVEVGEFLNELPSKFKYWKKSAKDNREKALVEYVDALHFQMSLFNHYRLNISDVPDYDKCIENFSTLSHKLRLCNSCYDKVEGITKLFSIGNYLGFTWDEIYKAYKAKNQVNYERLANGY